MLNVVKYNLQTLLSFSFGLLDLRNYSFILCNRRGAWRSNIVKTAYCYIEKKDLDLHELQLMLYPETQSVRNMFKWNSVVDY